jgi:hypothetical protein
MDKLIDYVTSEHCKAFDIANEIARQVDSDLGQSFKTAFVALILVYAYEHHLGPDPKLVAWRRGEEVDSDDACMLVARRSEFDIYSCHGELHMTAEDACRVLGISRPRLDQLRQDGRCPRGTRYGRVVYLPVKAITDLRRRREAQRQTA